MRLTYATGRLLLAVLGPGDTPAVLDYLTRNRAFHQPWFPERDDAVFTSRTQKAILRMERTDFRAGRALPLWLLPKEQPDIVIGRMCLNSIVTGAFQSAILSYHLDQNYQHRGLATEAGQAVCQIAFEVFGLHRLEANVLPDNEASLALALRLGFELEGFSPRYLQIAGSYADHLRLVRLADGPLRPAAAGVVLRSDRLVVRTLQFADCDRLLAYQLRNHDHLARFNPQIRDLSPAERRRQFCELQLAMQTGQALEFGIFLPDRPDHLIGLIHLRSIQPLPLASAELGFSLDQDLVGQGLAGEALLLLADYLRHGTDLHKITARSLAAHTRCNRLLARLGFVKSGIDQQAVLVDGEWQDLLCWQLFPASPGPAQSVPAPGGPVRQKNAPSV